MRRRRPAGLTLTINARSNLRYVVLFSLPFCPVQDHALQIGGGLAAGAALLGGGFALYKQHEKSEEEVCHPTLIRSLQFLLLISLIEKSTNLGSQQLGQRGQGPHRALQQKWSEWPCYLGFDPR